MCSETKQLATLTRCFSKTNKNTFPLTYSWLQKECDCGWHLILTVNPQRALKNTWMTKIRKQNLLRQYSTAHSVSSVASRIWLFATPWAAAWQASLSFTISGSLLKLMSIKKVMPSNHLICCCSLFLPPSIFPSIRVFSNKPILRIKWPEYWSFSFSISPSSEHTGLISFRMHWLDLLAV